MSKHGKTRIMVQLHEKLAKAIDRDFKALHIKRDGYLNELLTREIEELAEEAPVGNSAEVLARLQARKLPDRVKLNLDLDETLVLRMNQVLKERNVPRDSFVNRIIFFLLAKEAHLKYLGIDYEKESPAGAKPLSDAMGFLLNPFFHIREKNDGRFYTLACFADEPYGDNGPNLFALNTVITAEDWMILNLTLLDLGDLGLPIKEESNRATN